ncbi:MAG: protein-disulfide reductase DsbD domain-containing protein [Candidatus Acidiferrales bacterium]
MIREKYFEDRFSDRFTPNNVILKLFPQLAEQTVSSVNAPHLRISLAQSDLTAVPGSRITLLVEAELPPEVHVYSPGVKGYKPISLSLQPAPDFHAGPTSYPASKMLHLEAINETVPVFEGKFRIAQDVTFASSDELIHSLAPSGKAIDIVGELKYQACDKKVCYLPMSIPLTWRVQLTPLDAQRSPAAIQHK